MWSIKEIHIMMIQKTIPLSNAALMLKYGPDVLDKIEREKWEKVQEAHCEEMGNML